MFVAKEQRRFAHSAAEQKRRDAIRVSCCRTQSLFLALGALVRPGVNF